MKIINLNKKYSANCQEISALKNVSMTLPETGMVIITGKSGCGKTTLLHALAGLVSVDSGSIKYKNDDLCKYDENAWDDFRNRNVGLVFQNYELLENWTVEENVSLSIEILNISDKDSQITNSLEQTGILELRKRKVKELSGGQKQRVAISRAIIKENGFILADEPTGNLDSETSEQIWALLKEISQKKLVIAVTHDKEMAEKYSDRLIEMSDGSIINDMEKNSKEFEQKSLEDHNDQIITCRLPLKRKTSIAVKLLGRRVSKLIVTYMTLTIVLVLSLCLSSVLDYKYGEVLNRYAKEHNLRYMELGVQKSLRDPLLQEYHKTISSGKKLYDTLQSALGSENIIGIIKDMNIDVDVADKTVSQSVNVLCFDQVDGLQIQGYNPEKDTDILVSDYLVWKLGLGDSIADLSNKVVFRLDGVEYSICGVIQTDFEAQGMKKVSENYMTETQRSNLENYYNIVAVMTDSYRSHENKPNDIRLRYGDISRIDKFLGYMNREVTLSSVEGISSNDILCGRMPLSKDEILISEQMMYQLGIKVTTFSKTDGEVYNFLDLSKDEYNGFFGDSLNLYEYYPLGVKVVGVIAETLGELRSDYYIEPSQWTIICDDWDKYYRFDAYAVNCSVDCSSVIEEYDLKGSVFASEEMILIRDNIKYLKPFIIVAIAALFVLGFGLLLNAITFSIKDSSEMIGIFRALGMRKYDTIGVFICETAVILFPVCLLGTGLGFFTLGWVNDYLNMRRFDFKFITFVMDPLIGLSIITLFLITGVTLAIIRIIRMGRMKPVTLLNDKQ